MKNTVTFVRVFLKPDCYIVLDRVNNDYIIDFNGKREYVKEEFILEIITLTKTKNKL